MGWFWSRLPDPTSGQVKREYEPKNPLEMRAALSFAAIFVGILIAKTLVEHVYLVGRYAWDRR